MTPLIVIANLLGLAGLAAAVYYAMNPGHVPEGLRPHARLAEMFERTLRRRRVTALVMAVTAVLFLVGANGFNRLGPISFAVVWLTVTVLLAAILVLAALDLRSLGAIRDELERQVDRRLHVPAEPPEPGDEDR